MRRPRTAARLSDSLHRQLSSYALAAGAAGVGLVSAASPAQAEVVYTTAHLSLLRGHHITIDLNQDGAVDFRIANVPGCTIDGFCTTRLYATGAPYGNSVEGSQQGFNFAFALKSGSPIASSKPFQGHAMYYRFRSVNTAGHCSGPWTQVKRGYLGLKFLINGEVHFGWARLNASCNFSEKVAVLTGYAYETIPNKTILAGQTKGMETGAAQPKTLGQLAKGATNLDAPGN